jgi:class 3 adenylate cyclase/tetratricopeptide (TPR) repeat protein
VQVEAGMVTGGTSALGAYLPRFATEWSTDGRDDRWRVLDVSLCFVDISGFTNLSERLARRGRVGAEELTEVLDFVFSDMLGIAYEKGGVLLKFGGDALLLAFDAEDHARLATEAAVAMRAALRAARTVPTTVGRLNLRMSIGVHTGPCHFFRVGASHRELVICGEGATTVTHMEHTADANEIVVSDATAACLPRSAIGARKGDGNLLRTRGVVPGGPGPVERATIAESELLELLPVALRPYLGSRIESEHRVATVAFIRFEPIDEVFAAGGPTAVADALQHLMRVVQTAVDEEGVTFLATDVDENAGKVILVTGIPRAGDDDDGRMLRALRRIADGAGALRLRIGVNRGHVFAGAIGTAFRRTFTVMGDTVNLAARLMAACPPGSIYATAGVLEGSGTRFATEAVAPFHVKGKAEPVQAYAVGEMLGSREARASSLSALPYEGRQHELATITALVAAARDGKGAVVVVEAERGAGKTRLIDEVCRAAPDAGTLRLQGEPYATATPYLPMRAPLRAVFGIDEGDRAEDAGAHVVAVLERHAPHLLADAPLLAPVLDVALAETASTEALAPEFRRDRLAALVVELLDVLRPGLLFLVLDDAHWFDDATAHLAERLAVACAVRAWVLVAGRRPALGGFEPPVADATITLAPLDDAAAARLIDAATDAAPLRPQERQQLLDRAAGNPLFIEELVTVARARGFDALPESLDVLASVEIDALPPIARRVVRDASVLGRSFPWQLLLDVLGDDDDDLDDVTHQRVAHFLVPDGAGQVRFRHALLQEAAYESLPFRKRVELHRRAGEVIERAGGKDDDAVAPVLSLHFSRARDWPRAWTYARAAAAHAQHAYAPAEVAAQLDIALAAARALGDVPANEVASVLEELGLALTSLGTYEKADDAFRRAAIALKDDPVGRARMLGRRSFVQGEHQGRLSNAVRQARAGLALLDVVRVPDAARVRVQLLAREAEMRFRQGRLAEAARLCGQVMVDAEELDEPRALATAMSVLDACLLEMGRAEEATHMRKVLVLYEALGDRVGVAATLTNLGAVAFFEPNWDEATAAWAKAADAALQAGDVSLAAEAHVNRAEVLVNQGHLAEAEAILVPALRTLESVDNTANIAYAGTQLGRARAFLGDVDDGRGRVETAVATYDQIRSRGGAVEARARLAEVLAFAGDTAAASAFLDEARARAGELGETQLDALLVRVEITIAMIDGRLTGLGARLDEALSTARRLRADYDLLLLLELAERVGLPAGNGERAELTTKLGVVALAPLP